MENQQVDGLETCVFEWSIENFSKLKVKKLYSNVVFVGGYKWRILIFPKGNSVDHLSVYVEVADSATLPYGWSKYALVSLAVINQIHSKYTIKKDTPHHFNARESDWGYTSFMSLSDLNDPNKGYIVNDKIRVESFLQVALSDNQGIHASTGSVTAVEPIENKASVLESQVVLPLVNVGDDKDRTKVESAKAPVGGSKLQQKKDKQGVGSDKVLSGCSSARKESEAAANSEFAIGKAQESLTTLSRSVQGIPDVEIPEEIPYDGPGHGSDLVEWLGFRVQRRCVAYLNNLVERYPDILAHFSSRSPLVQAGHLGTLALLLYTTGTIPIRAWSNALHERFLSYIEDLREVHIELPWLVERFALLLGLRVRYLAKVKMYKLEIEAEKLRQEIAVLQGKLGVVAEEIVVARASFEAKEHLLSGSSVDLASDDPILSGLL